MTEEESHPSIVVVDDSAEDLSLVGRLLRQCNLMNPVVALASGAECIKWLKANSSRLPVLVLMDLIMYPTSGLDVLKAMKQMGILDAVPVIMLSGIRDVKVIHEGYQLGAKTFLIKPLKCEDLVEMIAARKDLSIEDKAEGYVLTNMDPNLKRGDTTFFKRGAGRFNSEVRV